MTESRQVDLEKSPGDTREGHRATTERLRPSDVFVSVLLVLLAALFRIPGLAWSPGWDGDEGYNLSIAWHLYHGQARAFALSQSFVQHPILYYALAALPVGVSGGDLWAARAVAALAGSLTAGFIYLATTLSLSRRAAVLATLAFAGAHFIVLHNRLAYTYNLLLLWSAVTLFCVAGWERRRGRVWLAGAILAAALGLLTDQVGIALPAFVAARTLPRIRTAIFTAILSLAPAIAFGLLMYAADPQAVLQDWQQSLSRVSGSTPETTSGSGGVPARAALWFTNYLHLLRAEWWWPAAVVGLFVIRPLGARRRLLALTILMIVPTFALREIDPFFRTAIPLFVPAAVGLGALLDAGIDAAYRTFGVVLGRAMSAPIGTRLAAAVVTAFAILLPLGLEFGRSLGALITGFETRFDWALVTPTEQTNARQVAAFVNARSQPGDVVITSPHIAWLVDVPTVDFFQSVAWAGDPMAFYPPGTHRNRFAFNPSPEHARFAVIDEFWRRWEAVSPPLARMTRAIETWPEVARAGQYRVYQNPTIAALGKP